MLPFPVDAVLTILIRFVKLFVWRNITKWSAKFVGWIQLSKHTNVLLFNIIFICQTCDGAGCWHPSWWRHQMETRWIPHTKASDAELWCFFFYLSLNKQLSKQSWGWRFETLSCPLWRYCNVPRGKQVPVYRLPCMFYIMAADDIVTHGARTSLAHVLSMDIISTYCKTAMIGGLCH